MKSLKLVNPRYSSGWWVTLPPFVIFLLPLLQGKVVFWGLPALQFIPWRHYAWSILRLGQIPLWNSLNGLGAPLLANYQLAFFYPPAFPLFLLDELWGAAGLAWGFTLLIPLHLAWGAWGISRFMETIGVGTRGKIVAGIAFGMSGYLVARGSFFSIIWAAAWIPWLLFAIEKILRSPTRTELIGSGRLLAIFLTMQLLAGHAQLAWYGLVFCALWTIFRLCSRQEWQNNLKKLGVIIGFLVFAILLAAVQLLPTFEYLQQSQRASAFDFARAMDYSFSPLRLIGFFAPEFFGNPGFGDFWGYASYWEDAIYIGLIPFVLALTTISWIFGNKQEKKDYDNFARLLWFAALSGVLIALGGNTPIFPWFYEHIPTFDMFQAPARWMVLPVLSLTILAGLAADQIKLSSTNVKKMLNLATFAGVILAGAAGLASILLIGWESGIFRGLIMFGFVAGISAFIARRIPMGRPIGWWGVAIIGWMVIDLSTANWLLNPTIQASVFNGSNKVIASNQISDVESRLWISPEAEYEMKFSWYFKFTDYNNRDNWEPIRSSILPNLNLLDELSMVNNFDPLVPQRFSAWWDLLNRSSDKEKSHWLGWAGATHIVNKPSTNEQSISLSAIPHEPRFSWTSCAVGSQGPTDSLNLVSKKVDGKDYPCIVIESLSIMPNNPYPNGNVQLIEESPNRIILTSESLESGWVLVRDTWFPGWEASVDGKSAELLPAEYLFKALPVPAGKHQIELEYKPASFTIGWLVSLVSWILFGLSWVVQKRMARVGNVMDVVN